LWISRVRTCYDPIYKVNPPLRTHDDGAALRMAVADDTIDAFATDHAPHPREDKNCEWAAAAFGTLVLQTALSVAQHTRVKSGLLDWRGLADRMSVRPARIGGVQTQGRGLEPGAPAHVCVLDASTRWMVDPEVVASKSRTTPYTSMELPGSVRHVIFGDIPTVIDGAIA